MYVTVWNTRTWCTHTYTYWHKYISSKNINTRVYKQILLVVSQPVDAIETYFDKERAESTHLDVVSSIGMHWSCLQLISNLIKIPARRLPASWLQRYGQKRYDTVNKMHRNASRYYEDASPLSVFHLFFRTWTRFNITLTVTAKFDLQEAYNNVSLFLASPPTSKFKTWGSPERWGCREHLRQFQSLNTEIASFNAISIFFWGCELLAIRKAWFPLVRTNNCRYTTKVQHQCNIKYTQQVLRFKDILCQFVFRNSVVGTATGPGAHSASCTMGTGSFPG